MTAASLFAVAGGGALGAVCRYLLTLLIPSTGAFPLATLSANALGAFAIGIASVVVLSLHNSELFRLFIQIGLIGGFTTFSSFNLETIHLWQSNKSVAAISYLLLSLILCFTCVVIGAWVARTLQHMHA